VFQAPRGDVHLVERADERPARAGQILRTKAEGYFIYRKGIFPDTAEKDEQGQRYCKGRKRAEMAVRVEEFREWHRAWNTVILAIIGEDADPSGSLLGAYIQDKHDRGTVSLRLELWFATDDEAIMNTVSEEFSYRMGKVIRNKLFTFRTPQRDTKKDDGAARGGDRADRGGGDRGAGGGGGYKGSYQGGGGDRMGGGGGMRTGGGDRDRGMGGGDRGMDRGMGGGGDRGMGGGGGMRSFGAR
jgi:hypothetical protein